MSEQQREFSIAISVDEWRSILSWMHTSLSGSESEAHGHFLLEVDGPRRTWVTTDGDQLTVLNVDGPSPRCNFDGSEPLKVLVNSRFFRAKSPEDVTLTVTERDDVRLQSLVGDGFEMILPEHPGQFLDWREVVNTLQGTRVEVDSHLLLEACQAVNVVPWGMEMDQPVVAWISVCDGCLILEAPWAKVPDTRVFIDLSGDIPDTVPVLVSPLRLKNLLLAIDPARVTLTLPDSPLDLVGVAYDNYQALLMPLDRWGSLKEHVEKLLCEFLRVKEVVADGDGDYPITTPEGNQLWLRLHTDVDPVSAQVFSVLAVDVPCTHELLVELNSINASAAYVKVMWAEGAIMAEADIVAESLDLTELGNALTVVQETADRYRGMLSSFFSDPEATE